MAQNYQKNGKGQHLFQIKFHAKARIL